MDMVTTKQLRKKIKKLYKGTQGRRTSLLVGIVLLCVCVISYASYMQNRRLSIDPMSYDPLLQLIASVESKNNYNAYFGNASNTQINFTDMSVADVMQWQKDYISKGNYSSAVGRYQIINTTLDGLIRRLGIDTSQKFDQSLQDRLAIALLERRGADEYINDELTREQFAANLAKEWAALPKVIGDNPGDSYYAGDGLNKALVKTGDVLSAIDKISPK